MKPCRRVGIEVTKRCNWRCQTCFYRYAQDFNKPIDKSLEVATTEMVAGLARGCDHAVVVGWGEPTLWPFMREFVECCKVSAITSSIITNGSADPAYYESLYAAGLNHLHVSVHDIGSVINRISGSSMASANQLAVMEFLKSNNLPWRSNTTIQRENYRQLTDTVETIIDHGAYHIVLLGFLPHYEWAEAGKLQQVAVHPAELRPYIEDAIESILDAGRKVTLRYHPMCHLDQKYWKYVTNARYVLYDPNEWDYGHAADDPTTLWKSACALGDGVAVQGAPCSTCAVSTHCGGWNATYAAGFKGAALTAITHDDVREFGPEFYSPGFLFDQNPANQGRGYA